MALSIPNELSSRFDTVAGRKELIDRYGDSNSMFIGNNAEGETVYDVYGRTANYGSIIVPVWL